MQIDKDLIGGILCLDFVNGHSRFAEPAPPKRFDYLLEWSIAEATIDDRRAARLKRRQQQSGWEADALVARADQLATSLGNVLRASAAGQNAAAKDLQAFNRELQLALNHSRLIQVNGRFQWSVQTDSDILEQLLWPIVQSGAELLVSPQMARLKICASQSCQWLFVDTTRNHRRRWCTMSTCGNREKVRRFRRRQKQAPQQRLNG